MTKKQWNFDATKICASTVYRVNLTMHCFSICLFVSAITLLNICNRMMQLCLNFKMKWSKCKVFCTRLMKVWWVKKITFMVESSAFKSYTVGSKKILKPKVCMFILALKIDKLRELVHVLSFKWFFYILSLKKNYILELYVSFNFFPTIFKNRSLYKEKMKTCT